MASKGRGRRRLQGIAGSTHARTCILLLRESGLSGMMASHSHLGAVEEDMLMTVVVVVEEKKHKFAAGRLAWKSCLAGIDADLAAVDTSRGVRGNIRNSEELVTNQGLYKWKCIGRSPFLELHRLRSREVSWGKLHD